MEIWIQWSVTDQELNQVSSREKLYLRSKNLGLPESTCGNIATRIVGVLNFSFDCDKIFDQAPK
jgi:hypothetical protein